MEKKTRDLIIRVIIILSVLVTVIILIYSYFKFKKTKDDTYKESIFTYLTTTYKDETLSSSSPLLGILNYNFDEVKNTLSVQSLINTNLMSSSKMNDVGVDNIYNSIYGISKSEYIKKPNYLSNGNNNCYYQRDVLNKNFNCDSICSMTKSQIMLQMQQLLQWSNVLPEDANTFCIKNAIYSLEESGYFVNLSDVKTIYKNLTNVDLVFNSDITNNKYYKYNSYLVKQKSGLSENIKEITSVDSVSEKDGIYTVEYTALTDKDKELKGTLKLEENNNTYYLISNKIDTQYILN